MKSQSGSIYPILIIIILIIGGIAYFIVKPGQQQKPTLSSSNITPAPTETPKQKLYEANKEKIKADLNMTEEEFQILKRFSED